MVQEQRAHGAGAPGSRTRLANTCPHACAALDLIGAESPTFQELAHFGALRRPAHRLP
jgi:hypothetical protein